MLVSLKVITKSISWFTHSGFILLLVILSTLSLSVLGYVESLYGLYEDVVLGSGSGLVISSRSLSPLTSVISGESVRELVRSVPGAEVKFIVFSPAIVGGKAVVVRGLERDEISSLVGLRRFSNSCVFLSEELARDLSLREDSVVPIYSPFTKGVVLGVVCGVVNLSGLMSREVLASVELARSVRGLSTGYYSVAVIHANNSGVLSVLAGELGLSPEKEALVKRALVVLTQSSGGLTHEFYEDIPEAYVVKLGLHRDYTLLLAYATATLVLVCNPLIGENIVRLSNNTLKLLRTLGTPNTSVLAALSLLVIAYSGVATLISSLIVPCLSNLTRFEVFNYLVSPKILLNDLLITCLIESLLLVVGVVWGLRRSEA